MVETAGPQSGSLVITALRARARRSFRVQRKAVLRPQQADVRQRLSELTPVGSASHYSSTLPRAWLARIGSTLQVTCSSPREQSEL